NPRIIIVDLRQRPDVDEAPAENAIFIGQPEREAQFRRADDVGITAKRIARGNIARADTPVCKATEGAPTDIIALRKDHIFAKAKNIRGLGAEAQHHVIFKQRPEMNVARARRQRTDIAAKPRDRLAESIFIARGREQRVIEMADRDFIPDRGDQIITLCLLYADRRARRQIVDLFIDETIEHIAADKLLDRETGAKHETGPFKVVSTLILIVANGAEDIKPGRKVPVEEIGFSKPDIDGLRTRSDGDAEAKILAAAEQVTLADLQVCRYAFRRREAGTDAELAGRFFLNIDIDNRPVRRRPLFLRHLDPLEEVEAANPGLGIAKQRGIERVSFRQFHFAADYIVERAHVAGDVDLLDIDARTLVDLIGHIDRQRLTVALDLRANIDEGIAELAELEGELLDRALYLVSIV